MVVFWPGPTFEIAEIFTIRSACLCRLLLNSNNMQAMFNSNNIGDIQFSYCFGSRTNRHENCDEAKRHLAEGPTCVTTV